MWGERPDFHSSWSLSRKGLGTPYPHGQQGSCPSLPFPLHWAVRLAWKEEGPPYWPQVPGLALPLTNPSLWRGVAPGASLGKCSRAVGLSSTGRTGSFPPPLGGASGHIQTARSRDRDGGVPSRKHPEGRPRAIRVCKQWRGGVSRWGLHASLGRGR